MGKRLKPPSEGIVKELKKGRGHTADRYWDAARAIADEVGILTWDFSNGPCSGAWVERKHMLAPEPTTRERLYFWAHACAHVALSHKSSDPIQRQECEAERWARQALHRHGVRVPWEEEEEHKEYVDLKILREERCVIRSIKRGTRKSSNASPKKTR